MTLRKICLAVSMIVLSAFAAPMLRAADDEMMDNPTYKSWASHKVGTSVTMSMDTEMTGGPASGGKGMSMTGTMIYTLSEVKPDQVVVEIKSKMTVMGQSHDAPARKMNIAAKVKKQDPNAQMPQGVKGEAKPLGNETLTVGDKSIECKVVEFKGTSQQGNAEVSGKVWNSDEVPGCTVKNVMHSEKPMKSDITMQVTAIDLK